MNNILLVKNADVFAPEHLGHKDVLVVGESVFGIFECGEITIDACRLIAPQAAVLEADGAMLMPGIVDGHVHFNGAGGEGGPAFRTPPLQLSTFIKAGTTTAVGLLGTDGTCRSLRDLLMKSRGLEEEGISTHIFTGSYRVPSATITGGVMDDICLIDKVIGLKIALSDHRSAHPSIEAVRQCVSDARTGGILAGKAGIVCVHMGDEPEGFSPILEAVKNTKIPLSQFLPTHVSRSYGMLEEAAAFAKMGGVLDITAQTDASKLAGISTLQAAEKLLSLGVLPSQITISSDGDGSMPRFGPNGEFESMRVAPLHYVFESIMELIASKSVSPEVAISFATKNAASRFKLKKKGCVKEGFDADMLLVREGKLSHVVAKGQILMENGTVKKKGTFEE